MFNCLWDLLFLWFCFCLDIPPLSGEKAAATDPLIKTTVFCAGLRGNGQKVFLSQLEGAVHILGKVCPRLDPDIAHMEYSMDPLKFIYLRNGDECGFMGIYG